MAKQWRDVPHESPALDVSTDRGERMAEAVEVRALDLRRFVEQRSRLVDPDERPPGHLARPPGRAWRPLGYLDGRGVNWRAVGVRGGLGSGVLDLDCVSAFLVLRFHQVSPAGLIKAKSN